MTTAVVLAFGGATTGALAQEPETPTSSVEVTPTSEPSTPPSTTDPAPPSTTEPAPPSTTDPAAPSTTQPGEPATPPSTEQPAPSTPAETSNAPAQPTKAEQNAAAELPDLKVAASIDKTHYQSHESVKVKVTVTNQSAFPAERVRASAWGIQVAYGSWGSLEYPGTTFAPGESRTVEVAGGITQLVGDKLDLTVFVTSEAGDAHSNDNFVTFRPTVTRTVGNVSGLVFADVNRNGLPDAGESLGSSNVSIYGGSPVAEHRTTTDANGRYTFTGVPSGTYYRPYYELPGGWMVHTQPGQESITVVPDQTTEVISPAERPYSEMLTASASLDRTTYAYPATAKITVTLTNTSEYAISKIQAGCNRVGDSNHFGFGPEWDATFGPGVDLAAGETKTFVINEAVPEGAAQAGEVWLACDFQPNPGYNADGPHVGVKASVTGGKGRYTMHLTDDKNKNWTTDPGEAVANLKIILVDRVTGDKVAEGVSNESGQLDFVDVPVGTYRAVILGPWAFDGPAEADQVQVVGWGTSVFTGLKPGPGFAELRATLKLDKASYESQETVKLSLTVSNVGGRLAERVRLSHSPESMDIPSAEWGDFGPLGPGVQIFAGESRTFEVSGTIRAARDGKLSVRGFVSYLGAPTPSSTTFEATAEVVQTVGAISGVAYADKNGNKQQDAGEAVEGVVVEARATQPGYFKTTTLADGSFGFSDLPSGDYYLVYAFPGGWVVHSDGSNPAVRVQPGAPAQVVARGERPYDESLSAKVTLDQDVYQPGEAAKISITLTNRGQHEISGIVAACNGAGSSNELGASTKPGHGWGDLFGPGVTVGAGETKTFVAIEAVPQGALELGTVIVGCRFAPDAINNFDAPFAWDTARVPGGFGSVSGELFVDRDGDYRPDAGETIGNTRIVLRDRELGVDVAETFSDDKGHVHFDKVPAGDFWAWVDGPWKFEGEYGGHVQVFAGSESRNDFLVVADPRPVTEDAPKPAPAVAAGGSGSGGTDDALAKTGASVLGLGLLGALLVAFGFGASLIGRRRQVA
ncbi:SdrD B-like domain-containing protein [Lentzea sp. NPDC051208]|uniref:SdrD B-like domain-containing protein n=1 Tax=Lentzea sp. NPDC051208 TaxID=3154642 RepID=UPI003427CB48